MGETKGGKPWYKAGLMDYLNPQEKPKIAPKAPAPVSKEDPNVRQAALFRKSRAQKASRATSRKVSNYEDKLG